MLMCAGSVQHSEACALRKLTASAASRSSHGVRGPPAVFRPREQARNESMTSSTTFIGSAAVYPKGLPASTPRLDATTQAGLRPPRALGARRARLHRD